MAANDRVDDQGWSSRLMIRIDDQGWLPTLMLDVDAFQGGSTDTSRVRALGALGVFPHDGAECGKRDCQ
jgi:hypothetical protein